MGRSRGVPYNRSFRDQFGREGRRETLPDPKPSTMRAAINQWDLLATVYASIGEKLEAEKCRDRAAQVRRRLERRDGEKDRRPFR